MAYLARPDAVSSRLQPANLLPALRSILVVGINYHTVPLPSALRDDPSRAVIASYAWGADYHAVVKDKLERLGLLLEAEAGRPVAWRAYVDTGPVLERDLAARAGLGFIGNNTCLINSRLGSWLLLGELLLAIDLSPASSFLGQLQSPAFRAAQATCGRCTRCLEACPTGALVAPHVIDARRCISYLTIELKGPVPLELRPLLGNRIFGCDVCQAVCPWNGRFSCPTAEPAFAPAGDVIAPRLLDLLALDEQAFARRFHDSPMRRAKRRGLLRSVLVALGNWADPNTAPFLIEALHDSEPLVRGHAAWALGCIGAPGARYALRTTLLSEPDPWVRAEAQLAVEGT
jgi:epoxyqueuosine reductase